ncbi:MAG: hypothetical protein A2138_06000 [Deltaproteobacteria bacterium RBG_16_71_12]|nr:MAG: hypothetical protein A2138_06000 [Deltaproteobacteria bacterium RBG_16_71_12]
MIEATAAPSHDQLVLLDALQRELPLVERPFADAARALHMSEAEVLAALRQARDAGWLVRVGPVFRPGRLGQSTLAAMAVPAARLEHVAALVSSFDEVNHNYQRDHPTHNLWFVVTAPDEARLRSVLDDIARKSGLDVLDLRLVREHHIDLAFSLVVDGARHRRPPALAQVEVARPAAADRVVAALQDGIPLVERPFADIARRLEVDEHELLASTRALLERGDIRRFGAVLAHRALGFTHNAMCVFAADAAIVDGAGERLAELPFVTLCYQRRAAPPRWPYTLYCMIHGKSADQVRAHAEEAARAAGLADVPRAILIGARCFKQRGAHYRAAAGRTAARVDAVHGLDDVDRRLIDVLQDGIAVEDHPFAAAARAAGIGEDEVVRRLGALRERGVLSRFGPLFDVERFGGHFTLVAMQVPAARFDDVTALINAVPEVAHNYAREHAFNVWFVLATETPARAQQVLRDIEQLTGLATLDLPRERAFHLGLRLQL